MSKVRRIVGCLGAIGIAFIALSALPGSVQAQQVRITKLSNASFGSLTNLSADQTKNQNVCVYSSSVTKGYAVTASGSGSGGAFTLSAGSPATAYEVQWSSTTGQTSGTSLSAGVKRGGFTSTATSSSCSSGPTTTASLIVILRATALGSATAGSYSGTLTLLIEPE